MTKEALQSRITEQFAGKLTLLESGRYDLMFEVSAGNLLKVARRLRDDDELKFDFLCNLGAVDTGETFEVVYSLASITKGHRLDFKVIVSYEEAQVQSLIPVWPAANWYEREMAELYGIDVLDHGNLAPLLLPETWDEGYPMRKNWDSPDFKRLPEV